MSLSIAFILVFLTVLPLSVSADSLVVDETNIQKYGYKYEEIVTNRESAQFTFQSSNDDLTLELTGYDIDKDNEVSVFVNQQLVGNLNRTQNNDIGPSSIFIPASAQIAGDNSLVFNQRVPGFKWGITDLLLSVGNPTAEAIPQLQIGVIEPAFYGYNYQGVTTNRMQAQFVFQGSAEALTLDLSGFDIDKDDEVAVSLNQQPIANLSPTPNNSTGPSSIFIPGSAQVSGDNLLSFNQRVPGFKWGISNLLLSASTVSPDAPAPISPMANSLLQQGALVNFTWSTSEAVSLYTMELIDTQYSDLSVLAAFVPRENCSDIICSVSISLDLPIGDFYEWRVRASNEAGESEWSSTAIEIIANATELPPFPTLLSPETGTLISQNDTVDFVWAEDTGAVTYDFNFFDAVTPENIVAFVGMRASDICSNGQCVLSVPVDLPVGEDHAWLVRGRNSLGASEFSSDNFSVVDTVIDIPGGFALISPEPDAEILENVQTSFSWTRAENAASFELAFVNRTDPDATLDIITINSSTCTTDVCSYVATPPLPTSGRHSWQVRAINTIGFTDWISAPISIIAESTPPAPAPVVIAPLANTPVISNQPASFQWEEDTNAVTYEFYLNDTNNGPLPVVANLVPALVCTNNVCSYSQLLSFLPGNGYSWHVRARYAGYDSAWSNTPLTLVADSIEPDIYIVEDTNVSGGGFQGDVTITDDGLTVYSSADNSGVIKSFDGGLRFESYNEGLQSNKVASLAITPDNNQILYAGTGDKGTTGGLFRSVDGGDTWAITADGANARFAGNHTDSDHPLPNGHPRSNGDLIVVDSGGDPSTHTDDIIIAGSYKNGVRVFTEGGENEAFAVNTSGFVRSVASNLALSDIAFAAIQFSDDQFSGIYKIDYSDMSNPQSTLEYPALRPEGLAVLSNGHVYAALGEEGIAKFDGSSWTLQNSGLDVNNANRQWTAIAGYVIGNEDIVYIGTNNQGGTASGFNYSNIWRTVDSGDTWSALVDANTNVDDTIYGKSYDWWYRIDAFSEAGLGRRSSIVSSIDVVPGPSANQVSDDIIYVSGRGGIWKSENGGNSWVPTVNNMQVSSNYGVAVNPDNPAQVVLANTDYVVLKTRSSFESRDISRDKPSGAESRAYDAIFDDVSSEVIIGVGDRDKNAPGGGEVFIKSANALGAPAGSGWTNTNLSATTASNNGRVRAVTYGYHDGTGSTTQAILAAVEGEGVFRLHGNTWTQSTGVNINATHRSNFVWPDSSNSGVVYLLDLSVGLYRSNDGGQSWTDIWPSMVLRNKDFFNAGYIDADDTDSATVYVSIQGNAGSPIGSQFRVFRMAGADTGIFGEPGIDADITDITNLSGGALIQRPGPLAFGPSGSLWLTEQQNSKNSIDAGLYVMENPASDTSFTEVTNNDYRNAAISPIGMDISSDGYIYISQDGGGVVKVSIPCRFHSSC